MEQQVSLARAQLAASHAMLEVVEANAAAERACVCAELRELEEEGGAREARAMWEANQLVGRFEEVASEYERQAGEWRERAAREGAAARAETAARIAGLEEQLAQMCEEMARRDAVQASHLLLVNICSLVGVSESS